MITVKNKSFAFLSLVLFATLILTSFASAAITFSNPTFSSNNTFTVTATNGDTTASGTANLNSILTDSSGNSVPSFIPTVNGTSTSSLVFDPAHTSYTLTYAIPSNFAFQSTGNLANFAINGTVATGGNITITNLAYTFQDQPQAVTSCQLTGFTNHNLEIDVDSPQVTSGYGSGSTWSPLDNISANVGVTNNDPNYSIRNIVLKWSLYNVGTKKVILHGQSQNSFSLNSDSEKKVSINFKLDNPNIINNNAGSYILYVWASGNDNGNTTCSYNTGDSVDIDRSSDNFVVIDSPQIDSSASCGGSVQLTGTVWNIGNNDENNVYAMVSNAALKINQKVDIGDINSFESKDLSSTINIPDDAQRGTYVLQLKVYNENNAVFQNDNGDNSQSQLVLNINQECSTTPTAAVTADLESASAKAGQEVDVKATIVNTGSTTKTFALSASGYADWASSATLDKKTVILNAGSSADVLIKLNVNKDVSGDKQFNVEVVDGNKFLSQPVKLSIEQAGFTFPSFTGLFSGLQGNNVYLWGIGALNVFLILIIIFVAVKVAKKKE